MEGLAAVALLISLGTITVGAGIGTWLSPKHRLRGAAFGVAGGVAALAFHGYLVRRRTVAALALNQQCIDEFCLQNSGQCTHHTSSVTGKPLWITNQGVSAPCFGPDMDRYRAEHS